MDRMSRRAAHTQKGRLRSTLREVMEPYSGGPDSTWLSLVVDIVVLLCILASCIMVVF